MHPEIADDLSDLLDALDIFFTAMEAENFNPEYYEKARLLYNSVVSKINRKIN